VRRTLLSATLLVSCASSDVRPATEEPKPLVNEGPAEARRRFDEIVQTIDRDALELAPGGDSLSKQVFELLQHDPAVVREVEADARDACRRAETKRHNNLDAPPEEQVIRFLHALEPRNSATFAHGFAIKSGAVVHEPDSGIGSNPWMRAVGKSDVDFETLVGDRPLRMFERPRAEVLFADLTPHVRENTYGLEDMDLAMALGEACASDSAAEAELTRRADRDRSDARLLVALGWSATAPAVDMLERRLTDLPPRDRYEMPWQMYPLKAATLALRHAAPERLDRLLDSLPVERSDQVAVSLGKTELVMRRLAALDATHDVAGRRDAIARLCRVDYFDAQVPSGDDAKRLFHALLEGVDSGDAGLRKAALNATETFLYALNRYPVGGSWESNGEGESETGESFGSYAGPAGMLRIVVEDLDAKHIEFHDDELSAELRHVATIPGPSPRGNPSKESVHVRVSAAWTKDGLRLSIKNEGAQPFAVDPVGMRYGRAEVVNVTRTKKGEPSVTTKRLRLDIGFVRAFASVPADQLITLAPGGVHECNLRVREDLRGMEHVDVEIGDIPVLGESSVPVLRLGWTTVL